MNYQPILQSRRLFFRAISLSTALVFLLTNLSLFPGQALGQTSFSHVHGGAVVESIPKRAPQKMLALPPELGTVVGAYGVQLTEYSETEKRLTPYPVRRTVYYIQDAHDSFEAQENIAKIIQHLVQKEGIRTVFEEGYEGPVPTDQYFNLIPDPELKQKVAYFLMDKLRLSGAEYAHIIRNKPETQNSKSEIISKAHDSKIQNKNISGLKHSGFGIVSNLEFRNSNLKKKDWKLIGVDHSKLYQANVKQYQKIAKHQKPLRKDLEDLGTQLKSVTDQRFSPELKEWMDLKNKIDRKQLEISDYLIRLQGLIRKTSFDLSHYPFITHYFQLNDMRNEKIGNCRPGHCEEPQGGDAAISVSDSEIASPARPEGELAARNDKLATFENNHVDVKVLMEELNRLEKEFPARLLKSKEDQKLYRAAETLAAVEGLIRFQLSSEKYSRLQRELETFSTQKTAELISELTQRPVVVSKRWEKGIRPFLKFYELAQKRDEQVLKNIGKNFKETGEDKAVLVFGGFHADEMKRRLQDAGYSYVVISPRITQEDKIHQAYYKQLMSAGYYDFEMPVLLAKAAIQERVFNEVPLSKFPSYLEALNTQPEFAGTNLRQELFAGTSAPRPELRAEEYFTAEESDIIFNRSFDLTRNDGGQVFTGIEPWFELLGIFPESVLGHPVKGIPADYFKGKKILVAPGYGALPFVLKEIGAAEVVAVDKDPITIAWQKARAFFYGYPKVQETIYHPYDTEPRIALRSMLEMQSFLARGNVKGSPMQGLKFQQGDLRHLEGVPEQHFDLVIMPYIFGVQNGLELEAQYEAAFSKALSKLNSNGSVLIFPAMLSGEAWDERFQDSPRKKVLNGLFRWIFSDHKNFKAVRSPGFRVLDKTLGADVLHHFAQVFPVKSSVAIPEKNIAWGNRPRTELRSKKSPFDDLKVIQMKRIAPELLDAKLHEEKGYGETRAGYLLSQENMGMFYAADMRKFLKYFAGKALLQKQVSFATNLQDTKILIIGPGFHGNEVREFLDYPVRDISLLDVSPGVFKQIDNWLNRPMEREAIDSRDIFGYHARVEDFLPELENQSDVIFLSDVIDETLFTPEKLKQILQNLKRYLKPGGVLISAGYQFRMHDIDGLFESEPAFERVEFPGSRNQASFYIKTDSSRAELRNVTAATDEKVEVYTDTQGQRRIQWNSIPDGAAKTVLQFLLDHHLENRLYLAGGAVRDLLLGLESNDFDFGYQQFNAPDFDAVEKMFRSQYPHILQPFEQFQLHHLNPSFGWIDLTINRLYLKFDGKSKDPLIVDMAGTGYQDLMNHRARLTTPIFKQDLIHKIRQNISMNGGEYFDAFHQLNRRSKLLSRIFEKIMKYHLIPDKETADQIEMAMMLFELERYQELMGSGEAMENKRLLEKQIEAYREYFSTVTGTLPLSILSFRRSELRMARPIEASDKGKNKKGVSENELYEILNTQLQGLPDEVISALRETEDVGQWKNILRDAGVEVVDLIRGKFLYPVVKDFLAQTEQTEVSKIDTQLRRGAQGRYLQSYLNDDFDFMVKMPVKPEKYDAVRRVWVGRGYKLARERLKEYATPTMVIDVQAETKEFVYYVEGFVRKKEELAIIQLRVERLMDRLKSLARNNRMEEAKELIDKFKKCIIGIFRLGVVDNDFEATLYNYGVDTKTGEVLIFDFGDLSTGSDTEAIFFDKLYDMDRAIERDLREVSKELANYYDIYARLVLEDFVDEDGNSLFGIDYGEKSSAKLAMHGGETEAVGEAPLGEDAPVVDRSQFVMEFPHSEQEIRAIFLTHPNHEQADVEGRHELRVSEGDERAEMNRKGQKILNYLADRSEYVPAENKWKPVTLETLNLSSDENNLIMLLGSWDDRTAREAIPAIKQIQEQGIPVTVLTSGKWGSKPGRFFENNDPNGRRLSEAEHYRDILEEAGIHVEFVEPDSTNTGQNIRFSKKLLDEADYKPDTIIVMQSPILQRRAGPSILKQYPAEGETMESLGIRVINYAPFTPQFTEMDDEEALQSLRYALAEIEHFPDYPSKGFMTPVEIPADIQQAADELSQTVKAIDARSELRKSGMVLPDADASRTVPGISEIIPRVLDLNQEVVFVMTRHEIESLSFESWQELIGLAGANRKELRILIPDILNAGESPRIEELRLFDVVISRLPEEMDIPVVALGSMKESADELAQQLGMTLAQRVRGYYGSNYAGAFMVALLGALKDLTEEELALQNGFLFDQAGYYASQALDLFRAAFAVVSRAA